LSAANAEKKTTETEKQALEATVSQLRDEMQALTTDFNRQLDTLRAESAALEKAPEIEKTSKSGLDQEPIIVSFG
jgi:hypothetical protein